MRTVQRTTRRLDGKRKFIFVLDAKQINRIISPARRTVLARESVAKVKAAVGERSVVVFAYGSNLFLPRIRARVPSVQTVGIGYVPGYRFAFHKRSQDGSAKADAFYTGDEKDRVYGAMYAMTANDKRRLDEHEFLGIGYDERLVEVLGVAVSQTAWIYVARSEARDASLLPYEWYHEYVTRGARLHRLPHCYVTRIRGHEICKDPNQRRHFENISICRSSY